MADSYGVEKMMIDMNGSLPINRRSILDHLENGDLAYTTRDGTSVSFSESELNILASSATEIEKMRVRLPIMVSTDTSADSGAWKIEGAAEVSLISKVLGKVVRNNDKLRLHYPDVKDLRKILPDLAIMVFIP